MQYNANKLFIKSVMMRAKNDDEGKEVTDEKSSTIAVRESSDSKLTEF